MNESGGAIDEKVGTGRPLPGHTHGQISIACSPPPRIQQPPAATAASDFSRDRSLATRPLHATGKGPVTAEDHRTRREEKRAAHGSLLLRLSSTFGAFPRSGEIGEIGSEGLGRRATHTRPTFTPRQDPQLTRGGVQREREREAGYRRAGSCAPALRVDNRPSAQTHGRHAGSQRQRECESAAERTRIVDLLKPDHDWVAVARFGNRRNSAAARGRWRALQDERERRRAEERERVVCEGLLTGVWPHSGRAPSAAVQQRDTSERSTRRPHSQGYQPTRQRRMSRRVPRPIAGSAHHSWNQYDSGRITRTVEPRSTISTACDAARGVARVAVSSGADHAGPPPPTLTAAPRGRHAAAVCARANCWRAAERTRRRRAWRVAPPCRRSHTVRHLAASTRLRRPPQHPPELWCNELGS